MIIKKIIYTNDDLKLRTKNYWAEYVKKLKNLESIRKLSEYNPDNKKDASDKYNISVSERIKKNKEEDEEEARYERINGTTVDNSEILIQNIQNAKLSLMREILETLGQEFGDTEANIEYHNYLYDKIIADTPSGIKIVDYDEYIEGGENGGHSKHEESYDITDSNEDSGNSYQTTSDTTIDHGETGDIGISDGMIDMICRYETGKPFGYTMSQKDLNGYNLGDANGHRTFGYGLLYHPITKKFMDTMKQSWTQEELESLFKVYAKNTSNRIDNWAQNHNIQLNQNQKDAIACACYNFGPGFLNKNICKIIANNPNNPIIWNTWYHLSDAQGQKYPGLIKRRKAEANWYFGR